jgi:hypothetical protein
LSETARKSAERQYLLGTLSADEELRVEEGFIRDDLNFEQLEIAEDELIDAYARGELSPSERRQFETKLLTSPRIVDRVSFARALAHTTGIESASESNLRAPVLAKPRVQWWKGVFGRQVAFPIALATCVALILIGAGFLLFSWSQLRRESDRLASERTALQKQKEETDKLLLEQRTSNEQTAADLQKQRELLAEERMRQAPGPKIGNESNTGGLSGTIVSMMLLPGSLRDSSAQQQLTIRSGDSHVRLNLVLENDDYRNYRVTITKARGNVVVTRSGLTARRTATGYVIVLSIPAKNLSSGNYVVTVRGRLPNGNFEEVEDYVFRISK